MLSFIEKQEPYHSSYQAAKDTIEKYGWYKARDTFNEQYPLGWKPSSAEQWQTAKGYLSALLDTA